MKNIFICLFFMPCFLKAQDNPEAIIIEQQLNQWHEAAAEANSDVFFGFMAKDAIYIGTDKAERWDKTSFKEFAKPYFDRGKAWAFTPYDRQIQFSNDHTIAWFSELLDTWMGVCRGSGVLTLQDGEWKLQQYHLSVTVPNNAIQSFIKLVEEHEKSK